MLGIVSPLASCSDGNDEWPYSALLVTLDTTRADALTCAGGQPGITPHLDALASEALRYERAYTVTPLTLPAHASMLTGLYPLRHGLRNNGEGSLAPEVETLAEAAQARGVQTAAFIASVVLDGAFGLDQGFDTYDQPPQPLVQPKTHYACRPGEEVVDAATRWLKERDRKRRFFLWVHLWDAHSPWDPPPDLLRLAPGQPYLGDVALADRGVGALLSAMRDLDLLDETVVVVVGDHGEAFWEHGEFSHGTYCYEETMRVPLLLRDPAGHRAGEITDEIVTVTDVYPTLAAAMGVPLPDDVDGQSLFRGSVPADRGVYIESYYGYLAYGWSPLTGWIDAEGKFLFSSSPEFYDVAADPTEATNLLSDRGSDLDHYRRSISALAARPRFAAGGESESFSRLREQIRSLGYAAETAGERELPEPLEETGLPSPTAGTTEQGRTQEAEGHFNIGRYREAEKIHRAILEMNPRNLNSLERLGACLIQQGRHQEAIEPLERAMASNRSTAFAAVNLGLCYRKTGKDDRAIRCFERALLIDGSQARALAHLADLHRRRGETDIAVSYGERLNELTRQRSAGK